MGLWTYFWAPLVGVGLLNSMDSRIYLFLDMREELT